MVSHFNSVRATFCLGWDQAVGDMAVTGQLDGVLAELLSVGQRLHGNACISPCATYLGKLSEEWFYSHSR